MAYVLNNSSSRHLRCNLETPNTEIEDAQENQLLSISDVFEAIMLADPWMGAMTRPYVEIIEQPASKALRFRYKCECHGRSAGTLPGVNSITENKTYPTIKVHNYTGQVVIQVSCVTKDKPYKPHPHQIVGREHCVNGVYSVTTEITPISNEYQFRHIGIQCVKRQDFAKSLTIREQIKIDPFRTGYGHVNNPRSIELNAVRLCFQVLVADATGRCRRPLAPVVSDIIYDRKAKEVSDLVIVRASNCSGTARGGTRIIILCEQIIAEDTAVVFFLEENDSVMWEETANMVHVHKNVAIVFDAPAFRNVWEHAIVHFQLKRISDGSRSNALSFEYYPDFPEKAHKKQKVNYVLDSYHSEILLHRTQRKIKTELKAESPSPISQYREQCTPITVNNMEEDDIPGPKPNSFPSKMLPELSYLAQSSSYSTIQADSQFIYNPTLQANTPNAHHCSSNMRFVISRNNPPVSTTTQINYPPQQAVPLHPQTMSRHGQLLSPLPPTISPNVYDLSPQHMRRISPNKQLAQQSLGNVSPNLVQQPNIAQWPVVGENNEASAMSRRRLNPFASDIWNEQ